MDLERSGLRKFVLRRQELLSNTITYGTIGITEEYAKEIVDRSNREDNENHYWYESKE